MSRDDPTGTLVADRVWKRFRADRVHGELREHVGRMMRRQGRSTGWRWALRDVSFRLEPGESLGIFGANGSGKSTLLKILSQVMFPYAGAVAARGRLGALIEVRAGIHPELSGRENIYLAGSLLGLRRKGVAARFDEIVEFAELGDAIDRPIKFYSTGMQTRLGFAVAAFLEPDILLVDEVLAVGDAAFQQRCLDRMRTVLTQGTTLVFVSHDLAALETTCQRGMWLRDGTVAADGAVREALGAYRAWVDEMAVLGDAVRGEFALTKCVVRPDGGAPTVTSHGPLEIEVVLESPRETPATLYLGISEGTASPAVLVRKEIPFPTGETIVRCRIADLPLPRGRFYLWAGVFDGTADLLPWQPASSFDVHGSPLPWAPPGIVRLSPISVEDRWDWVSGP